MQLYIYGVCGLDLDRGGVAESGGSGRGEEAAPWFEFTGDEDEDDN